MTGPGRETKDLRMHLVDLGPDGEVRERAWDDLTHIEKLDWLLPDNLTPEQRAIAEVYLSDDDEPSEAEAHLRQKWGLR